MYPPPPRNSASQTALEIIEKSSNLLTSLDVSQNTALIDLIPWS